MFNPVQFRAIIIYRHFVLYTLAIKASSMVKSLLLVFFILASWKNCFGVQWKLIRFYSFTQRALSITIRISFYRKT